MINYAAINLSVYIQRRLFHLAEKVVTIYLVFAHTKKTYKQISHPQKITISYSLY